MATPDGAPTRSNALGVVDPARVPGAESILRAWDRLPVLGQAFAVLALVDVTVRALAIAGLSLFVDLAQPITFLALLEHIGLVLLPTVVLLRRPDAATDTPLVVWGAVALALVELLSAPLFAVFPGAGESLGTWTLLHLVGIAGRGAGYVALGFGLAALTRSAPSATLLGLSNLVVFVIGASAATSILLLLLLPPTELGDTSWTSQVHLVNVLGVLPTLALAFLARIVVRGSSDLRRPIPATYTATGAMVLAAAVHGLTLAINVLALLQLAFALSSGGVGFATGAGVAGLAQVVGILLVVAFALGLADTSVRIPGGAARERLEPADPRETLAWPVPGGDVPSYRPLEPPPAKSKGSKPTKPAASKSSRQKSKEPPG